MKRGRPISDNKRTHQYRLRLNDNEWEQLQYLITASDVQISDILRDAIKEAYELVIFTIAIQGIISQKSKGVLDNE